MAAVTLQTIQSDGGAIVHGPAGVAGLVSDRAGGAEVIEACYAASTDRVLLHAENLPPEFFDLSSGVAGALLQKLRNYRIRLAVVLAGDVTAVSRRFGEMVAEERRGRWFGLFVDQAAALAWLERD